MLKHLPAKSLKVIENDLLYSKEEVVIPYNFDRRVSGIFLDGNKRVIHNVTRSDGNFRDREAKFRNQLKDKIDTKISHTLETDIKKLFESNKNLMGNPKTGKSATSTDPNDYEPDGTPQTPDVQIVFLKAPTIQYEQLTLDTSSIFC